jgi:hypothetical protein
MKGRRATPNSGLSQMGELGVLADTGRGHRPRPARLVSVLVTSRRWPVYPERKQPERTPPSPRTRPRQPSVVHRAWSLCTHPCQLSRPQGGHSPDGSPKADRPSPDPRRPSRLRIGLILPKLTEVHAVDVGTERTDSSGPAARRPTRETNRNGHHQSECLAREGPCSSTSGHSVGPSWPGMAAWSSR